MALFSAIQVETAQPLGPPDGRYLRRPAAGEAPTHVLVFSGATTTVVNVATPFTDAAAATRWLREAGETEVADGLGVLGVVMHAFRLIVADPHVSGPGRRQLLSAKVGYGDGEDLAEGRFGMSRELPPPRGPRFQRRAKVLEPQAKLAAALSGREPTLVCADLALRATHDLEEGRLREAALGAMIALNAAVSELARDPQAAAIGGRIGELRDLIGGVTAAAQTALEGPLSEAECAAVSHALARTEAALRARAVAHA